MNFSLLVKSGLSPLSLWLIKEQSLITIACPSPFLLFFPLPDNRGDEYASPHHWRNSGTRPLSKNVLEPLLKWRCSTTDCLSCHSSLFPSAPDQLRQKPWKPDRPRPAGQEPSPEGQRRLLWPLCQGLPPTRERVSSECVWVFVNVRSVSPFLLLCLSCFLSPYFFLTLYWLCRVELPPLTTWVCMWEWDRTRYEAVIYCVIWFSLYESMDGCFWCRLTWEGCERRCHTATLQGVRLPGHGVRVCKHTLCCWIHKLFLLRPLLTWRLEVVTYT